MVVGVGGECVLFVHMGSWLLLCRLLLEACCRAACTRQSLATGVTLHCWQRHVPHTHLITLPWDPVAGGRGNEVLAVVKSITQLVQDTTELVGSS